MSVYKLRIRVLVLMAMFAMAMIMALVMSVFVSRAWADGEPVAGLRAQLTTLTSGTAGTCRWELDSEGTLKIHPGDYDTVDLTGYENAVIKVVFKSEDGERVVLKGTPDENGYRHTPSLGIGFANVASVDLSGLDTSAATSLAGAFRGCSSLVSIDLTSLNTSNVTSMYSMFRDCAALRSLDLTCLDTSNVEDMSYMFEKCSALESVEFTDLDTSSVKNMQGMFMWCSNLISVDFSGLDISNVETMSGMFYLCPSLISVDFTGIDTSNVQDLSDMFKYCSSLTFINLADFDVSSLTNAQEMFLGCSSLASLDLSGWHTLQVAEMQSMFGDCSSLRVLSVSESITPGAMGSLSGTWKGPGDISFGDGELSTKYVPAMMSGTWKRTFDISNCILESDSIRWSAFYYTGEPCKPRVSVKEERGLFLYDLLIEDVDYKLEYENNVDAGVATATVTGIGNALGSQSITFEINPMGIWDDNLVLERDTVTYNGRVQMPVVKTVGGKKLKEGVDYVVSVGSGEPKDAGSYNVSVYGIGNYSGTSDSAVYTIKKADIAVPVAVSDLTFTGKKLVGVKSGSYYSVQDGSAKYPGSYTATITADRNHVFPGGNSKAMIKWTIAKASQKISAKNATASTKAKSGKLATNVSINLKKKAKVSAKTAISFKKVNKAGGSKIVVNKKTGKVTLKKGLTKGIYKVKVKLAAAANGNYDAAKAETILLKTIVK